MSEIEDANVVHTDTESENEHESEHESEQENKAYEDHLHAGVLQKMTIMSWSRSDLPETVSMLSP